MSQNPNRIRCKMFWVLETNLIKYLKTKKRQRVEQAARCLLYALCICVCVCVREGIVSIESNIE